MTAKRHSPERCGLYDTTKQRLREHGNLLREHLRAGLALPPITSLWISTRDLRVDGGARAGAGVENSISLPSSGA
eukprot:6302455-Amphidinium_carterae.1